MRVVPRERERGGQQPEGLRVPLTLACGSSEKVVLLSGPAKCELATSTSSASVPFEDKSQHGPVLSPGDVVGDTGKIL
ncbi:hypothetical protein PC128_g10437 [Phytophthora cactorum]|nr:hypothetical protein PC128_g10437 [Phytophthora cactorum]